MLGGVIAARWGWQAAFGVVGFPGLVLALLYLKVRDYRTVELIANAPMRPDGRRGAAVVRCARRWCGRAPCCGCDRRRGAADRGVGVWSWLPSFLNRVHGMRADQAASRRRWWCCAARSGSVVWGAWSTAPGRARPRQAVAALSRLPGVHGGAVLGVPR